MNFRRAWDGDGWQTYALRLVQLRHKPENVQIVPDKVRGDAGIEFFSTDGCLYQCYAPEEVADVAKAASAMKTKGARDLQKLVANQSVIANILQTVKVRRWILLCPFLDDKGVVAYVRMKGVELTNHGLGFIESDFQALVQSQDDFTSERDLLKLQSLGPPIQIEMPSDEVVSIKAGGQMSQRLSDKLGRAFPDASSPEIEKRKLGYIRAHIVRENTLDALRDSHPVLWERSQRCLDAEERKLAALGAGPGLAAQQLEDSLERIEKSLASDLSSFPRSTITDIAVGTVSDWLLRCPLDFPETK